MKAVTLAALSVLAGAEAAETILGAFIFHRHGDRTPKALAPTNLTNLGYEQVYASGQYYRSRYLSGDSKIRGLNQDIVKLSQIAVTAPVDNVLQNSAQGFLQAFYPPVQSVQVLANGQNVQAPMDGYQLIPINTIATGAGSEDAGWLQDASSCQNAKTSSDSYFQSQEYQDLAASTKDLYSSIVPTINNVISANQVNYKNAYIVYDILNVASIHNSSIPSSNLLTNSTFNRLQTLANAHEWGLAYNASDNTRAISGMQLAGEIISHLNSTITTSGSKKLAIQFGAYATFLSFFGLADLPKVSANFTGVVDYASSMSFELFTSADAGAGFPKTDDLQVRFVFHNGTATNASSPTAYPLFGGSKTALSWNEFRDGMDRFAVHSTQQWCQKCGETSGECAAFASKNGNANANANANAGAKGTGMSPAIGGVIGAMVTLAVVLGSLVAVMLVGGFRLVSKKAMRGGAAGQSVEPKA